MRCFLFLGDSRSPMTSTLSFRGNLIPEKSAFLLFLRSGSFLTGFSR